MELIDFTPLLGIPAVMKILDAYKYAVLEQNVRKTLFTVGSWVIGVGVTALVSYSSASPFPELGLADLILVGIGLGSTASVTYDFSTRGEEPEGHKLGTIEYELRASSESFVEE